MFSGIVYEIPDYQKIVHIAHGFNDAKLIFKLGTDLFGSFFIAPHQTVTAKLLQISPGVIALRHFKMGQLCISEFYGHIASVSYPLSVLKCLFGIGEKLCHFLLGFYVKLTSRVAHTVLVLNLFPGLQTQKHVVSLCVTGISVVTVICDHKGYTGLLVHPHKGGINCLLILIAVILHLQKIISFTKAVPVFQCRGFGAVVVASYDFPCHL